MATSDVHYVNKEDAVAQDILLCINTGKFRTDAKRMRMETNEFYLRSPEEMYETFGTQGEAVRRTQEIADASTSTWSWASGIFPSIRRRRNSEDLLRELCLEGLKKKYLTTPSGSSTANCRRRSWTG